ncbi:MAG: hypothetical protein NT178_17955 [Proteobacteria bacterium]|nr:hypothetical protein [Pseudomonadota bacterium]
MKLVKFMRLVLPNNLDTAFISNKFMNISQFFQSFGGVVVLLLSNKIPNKAKIRIGNAQITKEYRGR